MIFLIKYTLDGEEVLYISDIRSGNQKNNNIYKT